MCLKVVKSKFCLVFLLLALSGYSTVKMTVFQSFSVERQLSLTLKIPRIHQDQGILPARSEILTEVLEVGKKESIRCLQKLSSFHFDITFRAGDVLSRDTLLESRLGFKGLHLDLWNRHLRLLELQPETCQPMCQMIFWRTASVHIAPSLRFKRCLRVTSAMGTVWSSRWSSLVQPFNQT